MQFVKIKREKCLLLIIIGKYVPIVSFIRKIILNRANVDF
jgi:hypothetical protein